MTTVMIAVDDTPTSVRAARFATDLLGDDVDYLAVNVTRVPVAHASPQYGFGEVYGFMPDDHRDALAASGEAVAEQIATDAGLTDVEAEGDVGDPVLTLLGAARDHDADLIVVGTHDRSWWERLVQVPVARDLADQSAIPILVVPDRS